MPESKWRQGPLAGIRVVDLSRLAPGPYCTMLLADLGADVIAVGGGRAGVAIPDLSRGKRFIGLDLKSAGGREALQRLVDTADVLVEGFRPGVAERIGAGWEALSRSNPRLVYCSLTGYGQTGARSQEAGHDINYLAASGILGALGSDAADAPPQPPLNLLADFAAGSMNAVIGILAALVERGASGKGQYLDVSMVEGCRSLMAMINPLWGTDVMPARGQGLFNSPFYRSYACADGRFVAVGAIEGGFFEALWQAVGEGPMPDHMDVAQWPLIEAVLARAFAVGTRDHWAARFEGSNACVSPVLDPAEALQQTGGVPVVPRFGRTPGAAGAIDMRDASTAVLGEIGLSRAQIAAATENTAATARSGLDWPPIFKNTDASLSAEAA